MLARMAELAVRLHLPYASLSAYQGSSEADHEHIADALEAALAEAGATEEMLAADPGRLRVVLAACWQLLHQKHYPEALHLAASWGADWRDRLPLVNVALNALLWHGNRKGFQDEFLRLEARTGHDRDAADLMTIFLRRLEVWNALDDPFPRLIHFWGHEHDDLTEKIHDLRANPGHWAALRPSLIANLHGLREEFQIERENFEDRLLWGWAVFHYIGCLGTCLRRLGSAEVSSGVAEDGVRRLRMLNAAVPRLILPPAMRPLQEAKARGRPILICCAHAGIVMLGINFIRTLGLASARVVATSAGSDGEDFFVGARAPDAARQFLRLVKLLKREQRVIVIWPDGPDGSGRDWDLLGRKVTIGTGAALLAHSTGASVFFARTRWNGQAFATELIEGPSTSSSKTRETYEAEFATFYLAQIRDILLGQPEDMVPNGGFWERFT